MKDNTCIGAGALRKALIFALLLVVLPASSFAERWVFAAVADNRSAFSSYRNVLDKIASLNGREAGGAGVDFVLGLGDLSPLAKNHDIYMDVFKERMPIYVPVRGNHEKADDVEFITRNILPGYGGLIRWWEGEGVSYCFDWKNIRTIVIDQYMDRGRDLGDRRLLEWMEEAIESADGLDHVFVAIHEPHLPRIPRNDPFWNLLLKHNGKVRAVLAGHTHSFSRQRISDGDAGIEYVNAGNAGWTSHSDHRQTVIEIEVDGAWVTFRAHQAPDGTTDFRVTDQWRTLGSRPVSGPVPTASVNGGP